MNFEYWKDKVGSSVVYLKTMKFLDKETVGILESVHKNFVVIVYPQNPNFEEDGKGGWKAKKRFMKVYSHSAEFTEIKLV